MLRTDGVVPCGVGMTGAVGLGRGQHDLAVARELDVAALVAVVGHGDASHFRGVLGDHRDLGGVVRTISAEIG